MLKKLDNHGIAEFIADNYYMAPIVKLFIQIFTLLLVLQFQYVNAQKTSREELETKLKSAVGLEKLDVLNQLTAYYQERNSKKALTYGRKALRYSEKISSDQLITEDEKHQEYFLQTYVQLGEVLFQKENYFESQKHLEKAAEILNQKNDKWLKVKVDNYLNKIQDLIDSGEIKRSYLSQKIHEIPIEDIWENTTQDIGVQKWVTQAQLNEKLGKQEQAIKNYKQAIKLLDEDEDSDAIGGLQLRIAALYADLKQDDKAAKVFDSAINHMENGLVKDNKELDSLRNEANQVERVHIVKTSSWKKEQEKLKKLSETYADEKDYEKSLLYYKLYQELTKKMFEDSITNEALHKQRETEFFLLKQQKKIAELNVEAEKNAKEQNIKWRNTFIAIAVLILSIAVVIVYFYIAKRKQHQKLEVTYQDLHETKVKLEKAEQNIKKLLSQQVSGDVANALLQAPIQPVAEKKFVCIMFLDIRDYTPKAEKMTPEELIDYQNKVFGFMIDIIEKHHGNVNQLLGDGIMVTFGAPVSHGNDCENAFLAAQAILHELEQKNQSGVIQETKIGIGLHAGHVVTGNIGNESRQQYSVTGNTVIIASRVEQLNKQYQSQLLITVEVYEQLPEKVKPSLTFDEVEVKGRRLPVQVAKVI